MCVPGPALSISKEIMVDFHYEFIMKNFADVKLGFTDTDSFLYQISDPEIR